MIIAVPLTWMSMSTAGSMNTSESMSARSANYTALVAALDRPGPTKLHAKEREQLLAAADAIFFGEPDSEHVLRDAESVIETLETSDRWTAEACDQLRERVYGCDASTS
jgi:hypothetical protein